MHRPARRQCDMSGRLACSPPVPSQELYLEAVTQGDRSAQPTAWLEEAQARLQGFRYPQQVLQHVESRDQIERVLIEKRIQPLDISAYCGYTKPFCHVLNRLLLKIDTGYYVTRPPEYLQPQASPTTDVQHASRRAILSACMPADKPDLPLIDDTVEEGVLPAG